MPLNSSDGDAEYIRHLTVGGRILMLGILVVGVEKMQVVLLYLGWFIFHVCPNKSVDRS